MRRSGRARYCRHPGSCLRNAEKRRPLGADAARFCECLALPTPRRCMARIEPAQLFGYGASTLQLEKPVPAVHPQQRSGRAPLRKTLGTSWHRRLPETGWVCRDASWDWHKDQQICLCAQVQNDKQNLARPRKRSADCMFASTVRQNLWVPAAQTKWLRLPAPNNWGVAQNRAIGAVKFIQKTEPRKQAGCERAPGRATTIPRQID